MKYTVSVASVWRGVVALAIVMFSEALIRGREGRGPGTRSLDEDEDLTKMTIAVDIVLRELWLRLEKRVNVSTPHKP